MPDLTIDLNTSELRYRRLFETAQDGILIVDFQSGEIQDANPFLLDLLGYTKSEVVGKAVWELGGIDDKASAISVFSKLKETGYVRYEDLPLKTKSGRIIDVEFISNAYDVGDSRVIQCNIRDITKRRRAESALLALQDESDKRNWALLAYAHAAMALSRSNSPEELMDNVCAAIAQQAPFVLAWVGLVVHNVEKTVKVAGVAGPAKDYVKGIEVSWSEDTPNGRGPTGTCIRANQTVLISNTLNDQNFAPWRDRANQYGICCSVAVPITDGLIVVGALMVYAKVPDAFSQNEIYLFENLAQEIGYGLQAIKRRQQLTVEIKEREVAQEKLYQALEATIEAMSKTMEWRDPYTAGHQKRVSEIAVAIACEMDLDEEVLTAVKLACMVHDIGKVAIPSEILTKPSKLTDLEMQMVRQHVQTSYEILKDIPFSWPIAEMVYQHHERLDGSGYPRGLKGDQIMLESKIIAVADTIEAMAAHRPYRAAIGLEAAFKVIQEGRGKIFDPNVVDACLRLFKEKNYQLPT